MSTHSAWPDLPLSAWSESCETLYRWTQIVGKVRMVLTPLVNHWWNVVLYVTPRGLTTSSIPYGDRAFEMRFDLVDHRLDIETSDGATESLALAPMTVAAFYAEFMGRLKRLGIEVHIWTMPSEIETSLRFEDDRVHAQYDRHYVERFARVLVDADRVMNAFRARFIGKSSPVHFFWGGFDMAVTRFSGRTAPRLTSKTPNVADRVMVEAYSHEVSSCGFWPGNGGYGRAAFYVYAYPEPAGYGDAPIKTGGAFYDKNVGQFILPYDVARATGDPDALVLGFFQETYAAAADLGRWDREKLERQ
jgi:hypothetical protein